MMKRTVQSFLIAGACVGLIACESAAEMPSCTDKRMQKGARMAIENSYANIGLVGNQTFFTNLLSELVEVKDEITERNYVRVWKLRSANDLRICRATIRKDQSYMVAIAARNPKSPNEIGYVVLNIGLPEQYIIGEGWLNED